MRFKVHHVVWAIIFKCLFSRMMDDVWYKPKTCSLNYTNISENLPNIKTSRQPTATKRQRLVNHSNNLPDPCPWAHTNYPPTRGCFRCKIIKYVDQPWSAVILCLHSKY